MKIKRILSIIETINSTKYIRSIIVLIIIIVGSVFSIYKFWPNKNTNLQTESPQVKYSQVQIGEQEIKAEVVDNEASRMRGLSGKDSLGKNEGMLFVFEKKGIYPFWMKDMNFSIDIIWLKDKKVVDIIEYAEPPNVTNKTITYKPRAEADLVLETMAGFCHENNVKIGDEIIIK